MEYLEIAERCRQAAGIVGQGWIQGPFRTEDGVCAYGSLLMACDEAPELLRDVYAFTMSLIGASFPGLINFNEKSGRTQAEVVAKLHEIADAAELKAYAVGEVPEPPDVVIQRGQNVKKTITEVSGHAVCA